MIALTLVLALLALTAPGGPGRARPAAALPPSNQIGDILSVNLNPVGFTNLASLGLDGLTKARGQNGDVAVVGNTAFVGGGALFHGAQASSGRICTDYGGVKVVDITNPALPILRTPIPIVDTKGALQGPTTSPRFGKKFDNVSASAGAVDAMSVTGAMGVNVGGTPFAGDVLAIAIQRCEQSFFDGARVEFWNVSDPTNPVQVGTFDPPAAPWGIYEDVRMFTRVVGGVPKLYAVVTTPFSIGNSHGATTSGDMRVLDVTNLANPVQLGTFPSVQIGQSSLNGCKTFLAGRAAAPTPDHNGAILSFYDGSTNVANLAGGNTATVFKLDLDNLPVAANDTPPVAFNPQPAHYDTPSNLAVEGNAADVAPFTATTPDASNGHLLTAMSEDDIDPSTTHFNIDAPASAAYTSTAGTACEEFIGKKLYELTGQAATANIVDVGRGCPASVLNGTLQRAADPYLADPTGKIALVDSGGSTFDGCSAVEKANRAAAAGAVALLTNGGGGAPLNSTNNGPPGGLPPIPSVSIETTAVNKIQLIPNPNVSGTAFPSQWDRPLIGGTVALNAAALTGATTLSVSSTSLAIDTGVVVTFTNGVSATLTAPAALGATSLAVSAISGAIPNSTVGNINVTTNGTAQPGDTAVPVRATSVPIRAGTNLILGGVVTTLSADAPPGSTILVVNPLPAPITTGAKTSLVSNATVQPLCVVNSVSVTTAAAPGATTLVVRPTNVTLPAGSVLPFTGNNQVTLSSPAPAGSTSLSVNPIGAAIAANAAAIAACPDGTRADLYRTDVARYRSLANATDPTGKGQLNAANQFAVTAGQAYRASATLEVESYTSGTFQASVAWFNSGGVEIGADIVASQNAASPTRNTSSAVVTAPVGAVKGAMRYEWTGGGQGLAYADGLLLVPDTLHGGLSDTPGSGATPEWGAQRIIDFSTSPPSLLGTYRSPAAASWPPPDNGIYTPRLTKMLGNDIGFTTWMSDGLRVLDLRHPATPKLVASYVPPAVNDPAPGAGAGGGLSRGQVWPNRPLVTGVDVKPTGPDTGYVFISDINAGLYALSYSVVRVRPAVADFDASGGSDVAVFRPSDGTSYVQGGASLSFGTSGDMPVPGNYTGTTTTNTAVFRPSTGAWYVNGSPDVNFGTNGDLPVPGDYDGNGLTDRAVFRPSTGAWYVQGGPSLTFGTNGDIPVPGDYNGDGKTDIAVFRPSTGAWYVNGQPQVNWGTTGDIPVPGDYNGDGKTDIAVFRPSTGTWYVQGGVSTAWGTNGDIPVPGDYNADGTTDIAVFRPSTGAWYVNGLITTNWGTTGDIPLELPSAIRQAFFP